MGDLGGKKWLRILCREERPPREPHEAHYWSVEGEGKRERDLNLTRFLIPKGVGRAPFGK